MDDTQLVMFLQLSGSHLLNVFQDSPNVAKDQWELFNPPLQPLIIDHVSDRLSELVLGDKFSMVGLLRTPSSKILQPSAESLAKRITLWLKGLRCWRVKLLEGIILQIDSLGL